MQQDLIAQKIAEFFEVPERVADQVRNVVKKVNDSYILIETRPRWDGSPGPWTKLPIAKVVFHKPTDLWQIYWQRASGKWQFYGKYKTLNGALKAIKRNKYGCFWG